MDSLAHLFSSTGFMPHGHCFLWDPALLATYVLSDSLIGLSYYSIPVALWYFTKRRTDLPFTWVFGMFAVFIFACGTTHLLAIWSIWQPVYWLDAGLKAATATVSVATAILLWPLLPKALSLPSPRQLEEANRSLRNEIAERQNVERQMQDLNLRLEQRVAARTGELQAANEALRQEVTARRATEARLQSQLARLNLLSQTTRAISERLDLQSIFAVVTRSLEDHLPVDFTCILVYQAGDPAFTVAKVGARSLPLAQRLSLPEQARIDIAGNGLARCMEGQLVHEPDAPRADHPFPRQLAAGGLQSVVIAPLATEEQTFGALVAARSQPEGFDSADCEFLRQLCEQVALAANQAQLYAALQKAYDDVRETKQVFFQQERLRALGQMASGIAHDINNAIAPVTLYADLLLEQEPGLSPSARQHLETISRSIGGVAETVARMREFYRQRGPQSEFAPLQLDRMAAEVIELTRSRWRDIPMQRGAVIKIDTDAADQPPVLGVAGEIRDALTNLIFNAVDSMPEGGTLTVRSGAVREASGAQRSYLDVADTGIGMDAETRRRCLEPFFTTKGDRGTGLGLAMVYGTVQRHGADIEIDSAPGNGTRVRLLFPAAPSTPVGGAIQQAPSTPGAPMRILVIDDDPLLLNSLRHILESEGHFVAAVDGGQQGIDTFAAAQGQGNPFSVVITDLGMPHVDGRKVTASIKALSPATPVIMLTGWGQHIADENSVPPGVDQLIAKPPRLQALRDALARCRPAALAAAAG